MHQKCKDILHCQPITNHSKYEFQNEWNKIHPFYDVTIAD